ncbi:pyridoxamine 5'-phosphate oxidase [Williamsia sp. D3]|nr:pyridoxamine 5'-phosphate oxidase [Williamsia sp. D3]
MDLSSMRVAYSASGGDDAAGADGVRGNLDPSWLAGDPPWLALFGQWLREAIDAAIAEPNAMVLGTVDADGHPSTRTVLCKGADADGVMFFTGYDSDKANHLASTPYASVTFPWIGMERQVHFRGPVSKVTAEATENYWVRRPRGSQLSAYASEQSAPIESRQALEERAAAIADQFGGADGDQPVPVPPRWGGYRLTPTEVEFWQGRANRLHNRVRCTLVDGRWRSERLQP